MLYNCDHWDQNLAEPRVVSTFGIPLRPKYPVNSNQVLYTSGAIHTGLAHRRMLGAGRV